MFDVFCFFGQDCISIVVKPFVEIADVSFWDRRPCSDLGMLDNEFIWKIIVSFCLQGGVGENA